MNSQARQCAESATVNLNYAGTLRRCAYEIRNDPYWKGAARSALAFARRERDRAQRNGWKLP